MNTEPDDHNRPGQDTEAEPGRAADASSPAADGPPPATDNARRIAALRELSDDDLLALAKRADTAEQFEEKHLYALAEVQNNRRLARRDEERARFMGKKIVLEAVLPVFDALHRALSCEVPAEARAFADGIAMVEKQLGEALNAAGLERIETKGARFDPTLHEAMFTEPSADVPEGTVLRELEAGYRLGDVTLRAAKVAVSVAPQDSARTEEQQPRENR